MATRIFSLAERPDLTQSMWDMPNNWPIFLLQDPISDVFFPQLPEIFPEFQLVAVDAADRVVGKIHSVPFRWDGTDEDLPSRGWDAIQQRSFDEHQRGVAPTAVSLLEARVVPDLLGTGFSRVLLEAAGLAVREHGMSALFGPVRPTQKVAEPETPMLEYVQRTRDDGLPWDAWIRTHVRMGARIVKVCPAAMVVADSLESWRGWTGLPLTESGPTVIPGGIVPADVSVEQDRVVYVEPNVWMHHPLT